MLFEVRAHNFKSITNSLTSLILEDLEDRRFLSVNACTSSDTTSASAETSTATFDVEISVSQMLVNFTNTGQTGPIQTLPAIPWDDTWNLTFDCPHKELCPPSIVTPYSLEAPPSEFTEELPMMDLF